MKKIILISVIMTISSLASADDNDHKYRQDGFQASIDFGVMSPNQDVFEKNPMSNYFDNRPFVGGEVGYRIKYVFFGGYYNYGWGGVSNSFKNYGNLYDFTPSSDGWRAGPIVRIYMSDGNVAPWVSIGFGYEEMNLNMRSGSNLTAMTFSGIELGRFGFGIDITSKSSPFSFGPFVDCSLGKYDTLSVEDRNGYVSRTKDYGMNVSNHNWITFGLKSTISN